MSQSQSDQFSKYVCLLSSRSGNYAQGKTVKMLKILTILKDDLVSSLTLPPISFYIILLSFILFHFNYCSDVMHVAVFLLYLILCEALWATCLTCAILIKLTLTKFCGKLFSCFCVILFTNKQTNQQMDWGENITVRE